MRNLLKKILWKLFPKTLNSIVSESISEAMIIAEYGSIEAYDAYCDQIQSDSEAFAAYEAHMEEMYRLEQETFDMMLKEADYWDGDETDKNPN
jgi:heptaprenylglyceryl phosphate synthase